MCGMMLCSNRASLSCSSNAVLRDSRPFAIQTASVLILFPRQTWTQDEGINNNRIIHHQYAMSLVQDCASRDFIPRNERFFSGIETGQRKVRRATRWPALAHADHLVSNWYPKKGRVLRNIFLP